MTLLLIVLVLAVLAVLGPLAGADSRRSGGWSSRAQDGPLWETPRW
ncbi:hypothetical protein [Nakamurella leprariae]|uniref:Uncharacterized protein n=1 Tax=Nakamurella leprariae TaxID=2803911 RepID=A0A938Y9X2_9ACTN|nr:hypothetical protein [Nakamurella leprariae]MBM9465726.1 hypothetical protein [Nakamurella leprariae]